MKNVIRIRTLVALAVVGVIMSVTRVDNAVVLADNDPFLGIALECHDYIRENGFYYSKGVELPLDREGNKRVDCSSYVSWCIYEYTGGDFNLSRDSAWFMDVAKALANDQTPDMPEITSEWDVITNHELEPGDIMCYNGHVHIYAGIDGDGQRYVYSAGGNEAIQDDVTIISEGYFQKSKYALRIP